MKKLLFFITTLNGGGAELVVTNSANALSKKYDVTVMTLINDGVYQNQLNRNVKYKSILNFNNSFFTSVFTYLLYSILPSALVHKLFIGNRYDYEIAFLEGFPTKLIANAKTKKYAWVHIDLYNFFGLEKVHKSIDKHIDCYKKYDKIICVSESVKAAFTKRFGINDNLIVKYNLIDDGFIREKANEKFQKSDKFRILSVGRLAKQKGYDILLPILKKIYDDGIDFEFVLVGDGEKRDELKKQANELGISHLITFTGFVDNPYKYIASADLLVFPSRNEGYSTVVCEGLIIGKPMVVSSCSGMKEILGDSEYGIVTNNDAELYTAIKSMILDANLRNSYAKKATERAKRFSMSARISELEELFND